MMKRIQLYMDRELDRWLIGEARRNGCSKSTIVRECVRQAKLDARPAGKSPLDDLVGAYPDLAVEDIDRAIYDR